MDKEKEKIKLNIQMLESQRDYHKFRYDKFSTHVLELFVLFATILLMSIIEIKNIWVIIVLSVSLIITYLIVYTTLFARELKKSSLEIEKLSKKINSDYRKLLKK